MNLNKKLLSLSIALSGSLPLGAVTLFSETFENPVTSTQAIPTGLFTFDNTWNVISNDDRGVALLSAPQRITIGFSDTDGVNSIETRVDGFDQTTGNPTISFEHFNDGNNTTQMAQFFILDPNDNGAILYSSGPLLNAINISTDFKKPVSDSVFIVIRQTVGSTLSSDNSFDNILITAVPEPSSSLLLILSGCIFLYRRRS